MIRFKPDEAMRAGLIDPLLAQKIKEDSKGPTAPKKKSRPAAKLVRPYEIPGFGDLVLDPMGIVQRAEFVFHVMPVPKERPRVVRNRYTGKIQTFTPDRTSAFDQDIQRVIEDVMLGRPPIDGPIRMEMTFRMPVPVSWPKWRKEAALDGVIYPTGRPDMDNLEKALLDALNECLIADDALVVSRDARKIFSTSAGIDLKVDRMLGGHIGVSREQANLIRQIAGILGDQK